MKNQGDFLVGIDRDGTINKDPGYFGSQKNWREILELYDGVIPGIKSLNQYLNIKTAIITNQAGAANRLFGNDPEGRIQEVNSAIDLLLMSAGAFVDTWQYCPWVNQDYIAKKLEKNPDLKPDYNYVLEDDDPRLELRKPGIGMLKEAAEEIAFVEGMYYTLEDFLGIYFIGDKKSDIDTALNANGKGVFVYNKGLNEKDKEKIEARPEHGTLIVTVTNLIEASEFILDDISTSF